MNEEPTRKVVPPGEPDQPPPSLSVEPGTRRVEPGTPPDGTRRVPNLRVASPRTPTLGTLQAGAVLLGDCVVIETVHPHETEHPGLFVCRSPEGTVMVKVAPVRHPPKRDLWERLPSLSHPNVLKVHRVVEDGGLFYEVQEFCFGGSLTHRVGTEWVTPQWVMRRLVPQVNEALKYLHSKGIVHRDVKPANIFLREDADGATVVLGDFDISSVLESTRTSRDTTRAAGTWEYTPPEAFPRFVDDVASERAARVTRTADYYSLGVTIIELLVGTTSLHACDLPDLFDFYLSGGRVELPNGPPELLRLLKGLLIRSRHKRWSGEQVDRWIQGKNTEEDLQAVLEDEHFSLKKAQTPYSIGSMHATDLKSLAEVLLANWETAKSDLLERNHLTNWIATLNTNVARHVDRERERWRQAPDIALFRAIMLCDPARPFWMRGFGHAHTAREWLDVIVKSGHPERYVLAGPVSNEGLLGLQSWLELKARPEPELAARVGGIRQAPLEVRFEEMAYLLDPTLPYSHEISALENLRRPPEERTGAQTPAEVARQALGSAEDWKDGAPAFYRSARDRWTAGFLDAWMRQRGLLKLAAEARKAADALSDYPNAAFDAYLRRLEADLPRPTVRFNQGDLARVLEARFGEAVAMPLRYETEGAGVPFGAVRLLWAPEGLRLRSYVIANREGELVLELNSRMDVKVSRRPRKAALEFERGNFVLADDRALLAYKVAVPLERTVNRIFYGAVIGGMLVGLARLVVVPFVPRALLAADFNFTDMAQRAARTDLAYLRYVIAFLIVAAWLYMAYRIWLRALARSEA